MVKAKVTLSIDANTWEQFKSTYDNASEEVQELMRSQMDVTKLEDSSLLKKRIQELEEEQESIEDDIADLEAEKQGVENELSAARATLEKMEREEEEKQEDLGIFLNAFENKHKETSRPDHYDTDGSVWAKPEHIPRRWPEDTGLSKEELWEKGIEEVEE